jgi:UDP-N-acetylmuramoyl-tripeptide--D-alanyl-D-alanine ligase
MRWTMEQVAAALGVAAPAGVEAVARVAGVSIDSRTLRAGELFVAIHGPRHDGHTFVAAALADGACAAVVAGSRVAEYPEETRRRLCAVDDPLAALQLLAREVRRAWGRAAAGRQLAAVTGSTGKTTTKEILAALLGARFRVLKSEGNLNNEYGLPLTLLKLDDAHDAAVVEVGMSARGELARLAEIGEPHVGVVTNVAPVHLEFFSSVDEIALAKRELIEGLAGKNPVAVLNADDARVAKFAEGFRGRVLTFGSKGDFRAARVKNLGAEGWEFDLESPAGGGRLRLPLGGPHLSNALAALAAASVWGIGANEAAEVFPRLKPAAMRGEVLRFEEGFAVINDCYNSNPLALEQMLALLAATPGYRRRIVVAGEMLELGATSPALHRECGRKAAAVADWVFGVQGQAKEIVAGAVEAGLARAQTGFFETSDEAAKFIAGFVKSGDLVLVKGSRGVRMEKIIGELKAQN